MPYKGKHGRGQSKKAPIKEPAAARKKHSTVKKQIRDTERLLKKDSLDYRLKKALTKRLDELRQKNEQHKRAEIERKYATRYHMAKFFERQKIQRRLDQAKRNVQKAGGNVSDSAQQEIQQLEEDLQYVLHFPKGEKFVSLLKNADTEEGQATLDEERLRLRQLIRRQLADEALMADADEGKAKGLLRPQTAKVQEHAAEAEPKRGMGSRKLVEAHDVPRVKKARRSDPQEVTKIISRSTPPVGQDDLGMASASSDSDRPVTPTPAEERQNGAAVAFDDDFFLGAEEQVPEKEPMAAFQLEDVQHSRGSAGPRTMPAHKQLHKRNRTDKQPIKQTWKPQKVKVLQQGVRSTNVKPDPSLPMSGSHKRQDKHPTKVEAIPHRTRAEGGRKRRKK